ncbi:hypothetical protein GMD78_09985 [Ornithinibacillus sp. L9]|uniref:ABC transporter permease n=1 Tax=Ornithinibacillus caprae TaxID=2678566 RepID=A0A6N8FHL8_9BACI|nr:hypothetical protein [Ornithinibacillus caprae]MUK88721.1 hypothetical protein [Ornithinibacillus caprae]
MSSVEIAAPIASLGYFTGENKTFTLAYPHTSSYIETEFNTTDGVNEYTIRDEGGYFYVLEQEGYLEGFDFYKEPGHGYIGEGMKPEFGIPLTYHLTVGVDQEEEEKLTGIDLSALKNPIPAQLEWSYSQYGAKRNIPIIYLSDSFVSLRAETSLSELDWGSEQTIQLKEELDLQDNEAFFFSEKYETLGDRLSKIERLNTEGIKIFLSDQIKPFYYEPFSYNYDGTFSGEENYSFGISETPIFYRTKPIDYTIRKDQTLEVKQIGQDSGVPVYREIEKQGVSVREKREDIPFLLYPVGTFTTKSHQESLAASPLGIYQQAPTTKLDDGTTLHETITPGSFISSPAHGIVSLEDAAYIKGDAPIDAIRLRVDGINSYNEEAIRKINDVILDISEIGGFDIVVVAGASPSPVIMDVEGVGEVEQSWTSLGAAATISEGWNTTNLLISSVFLMISIVYIVNHAMFRKYTKKNETKLLSDIGWKVRHIKQFHLIENYLLIIFSGILGGLILFILYLFNLVSSITLVIYLIIVLLTFLIPFLIIVLVKNKLRSTNRFNGVKFKKVWLKNVLFYKKLIILCFLQLIFVTFLFNFVPANLFVTNQSTGDTNLGVFINDLILILILVILVATLYIATTTIIDSISSFLFIRKEEILTLRDIGWRVKDIHNTFMKESIAWIIPSFIIGMAISIIISSTVLTFTVELVFLSICITLLLSIGSMILVYNLIKRTLKKI